MDRINLFYSYMIGDKAEGFPKPLPDAFVSFRTPQDKQLEHYIIECFDDTMPQSAMKKRIGQLINHADSGDWTLTKEYPRILLVCETERLQKLVRKWVDTELEQGWSDNLIFEVKALTSLQLYS